MFAVSPVFFFIASNCSADSPFKSMRNAFDNIIFTYGRVVHLMNTMTIYDHFRI